MAILNKFNTFLEEIAEGVHDLGSDTLKIVLTAIEPQVALTEIADIIEIVAGSGYSAGGATLTVTSSVQTDGVYRLIADNVVFTAAGGDIGPFRYAALYNADATAEPVIGWWDIGQSITIADATSFTLHIDQVEGLLQVKTGPGSTNSSGGGGSGGSDGSGTEVFANEILHRWTVGDLAAFIVSVEGQAANLQSNVTLASGAIVWVEPTGEWIYMPNGAGDSLDPGETLADSFTYVDATGAKTRLVTVKASEEVGANIAVVGGLTGANWAHASGAYTHTAGSTAALAMSIAALTPGAVYQVALTVAGRTAGTLTPSLVGATTTSDAAMSANERYVFLLRVPATPATLNLTPSSDFDGTVSAVHVRPVVTTGAPPVPRLSVVAGATTATIKCRLAPVTPLATTADTVVDGALNTNEQFGIRDTSGVGSWLVRNAQATGKRVAISLRGGTTLTVQNVTINGPYTTDPASQFQHGINPQTTAAPWFSEITVFGSDIDLGLTSNLNDYTVQNSEPIVLNREDRHVDVTAWIVNNSLRGGSDASIDSKANQFTAYNDFDGAFRTFRLHEESFLVSMFDDYTGRDTATPGTSLWLKSAVGKAALFKCRFGGVEYQNAAAALAAGAIKNEEVTGAQAERSFWFMKTLPRMPDRARLPADTVELQIRAEGGGLWSDIAQPDLAHPMRGALRHTATLAAGNWEVRARSRHGAVTSDWSDTVTFQIGPKTFEVLANDHLHFAQAAAVGDDPSKTFALVEGNPAGQAVLAPSGALVWIAANGRVWYEPNGAFDHLNPGESAVDTIRYDFAPVGSNGINLLTGVAVGLGTGWVDNGGGSYSRSAPGTSPLTFGTNGANQIGLVEGTSYRISGTITGRTTSNLRIQIDGATNVQGGSIGVNGDFVVFVKAPASPDQLYLRPLTSWDGTVSNIRMELAIINSLSQEITVLASERVGANIVANGDFSGSGWAHDGTGGYTKTPGDANPLDMTITTPLVDEVWEITPLISGRTAGTITVQAVGTTTATAEAFSVNHRVVTYVRMPASPATLRLLPSTTFDGKVSAIRARKVLTSGAVPAPVLAATGAPGAATLRWTLEPVGPVPSSADQTFTGVLSSPDDGGTRYGVNDRLGEGSFLVHDFTATNKKDSINLRGGTYAVVRDGTITGPWAQDPAEKFQSAIKPSDGFPVFPELWLLNLDIDLNIPAAIGFDLTNSEPIVLNRDFQDVDAFAYILNCQLRGGSDASVDNKLLAWGVNNYYAGGARKVRSHFTCWYQDVFGEFVGVAEDAGHVYFLQFAEGEGFISLFRSRFDGVEYWSAADIVAAGLVQTNAGTPAALQMSVRKTLPAVPDAVRPNVTDMEFEISADGAVWSTLAVADTGLPGVRGAFARAIALATGTWFLRCRARNGASTGDWSNVVQVIVT